MVDDMLRWDQHRAGYIQRKLSGNVSQEDVPISNSKSTVVYNSGGGAGLFGVGGGGGTAGMAKVPKMINSPVHHRMPRSP
jgi:hypothetical protein